MLLQRLKEELKKGAAHTLEIIVISGLLLFFVLAPIVYFNIINTNNNLANVYNNTLQLASERGGIDEPLRQALEQELVDRRLVRASQVGNIQVTCFSNDGTDCTQQMLARPSNDNDDYVVNLFLTLPSSPWRGFLSGVNNLIGITTESRDMLSMGGSTISQREEAIPVETMPIDWIFARPIVGITNPARASVPDTNIENGNFFSASVFWNVSPALFTGIAPATFDSSRQYVATVVLTAANDGVVFAPSYNDTLSISSWTVNGLSPSRFIGNTGNQLMFEVTFPQTIDCPMNAFGSWSTTGTTQHIRNCTRCSFFQTENHTWPNWGSWSQGNASNHTRSRTCSTSGCGQTETENESHNTDTKGSWSQGDSSNHTRTQHCSVCNRQMANETQAHTWSSWSSWSHNASTHTRTRRCNTCNRSDSDSGSHSWSSWSSWSQGDANNHTRSRSCNTCNRSDSDSASHSWGSWSPAVNTRCTGVSFSQTRSCSTCNRSVSQSATGTASHSYEYQRVDTSVHNRRCTRCGSGWSVQSHSYSSWSNHSSSVHRRTCSLCSQIQEAAHSFGACQWRSANNRMEQQCSICNGWRTC